MKFSIKRTGDAIGDHMMAAFFVQLLIDNNIDAVYGANYYRHLVAVPLSQPHEKYEEFYFQYHEGPLRRPHFNKEKTILELVIQRFCTKYDIHKELKIVTPFVPVIFKEDPNIPKVDITLVTKSGKWSKYRNWPYFGELKKALTKKNLTFIDLTEKRIYDNNCLNYVKKSRLFIGLETGASHYVSMVANKALIIQSGYSSFDYWCPYPFEYIAEDVACKKCFIHCKSRPYRCSKDHKCMRNLSVDEVMKKIEMLF